MKKPRQSKLVFLDYEGKSEEGHRIFVIRGLDGLTARFEGPEEELKDKILEFLLMSPDFIDLKVVRRYFEEEEEDTADWWKE